MDALISLYDNALIYYPNVFLAAIFLFSFLIVIFLIQTIIYVSTFRFSIRIKSYNYPKKFPKISISNYPIIVMEKFIIQSIRFLEKTEMRTEKLIKKIGKEILIDEKD